MENGKEGRPTMINNAVEGPASKKSTLPVWSRKRATRLKREGRKEKNQKEKDDECQKEAGIISPLRFHRPAEGPSPRGVWGDRRGTGSTHIGESQNSVTDHLSLVDARDSDREKGRDREGERTLSEGEMRCRGPGTANSYIKSRSTAAPARGDCGSGKKG